jgi:hypothetical protein
VVTVVDVLGEAVRSLKTTDQRTTIDVSDLPAGTYHINIVAADMYRLVRVVVR